MEVPGRVDESNSGPPNLKSNGLLQLSGCLSKIAIEKRRNLRITFCECFSHLFLIIILVQGYGLSKILNYDAFIYSQFVLSIPSTLQGSTSSSTSSSSSSTSSSSSSSSAGGALNAYHSLINGPLIVPTFDEYIYASRFLSSNVGKQTGTLLTQTTLGRSFTNL